MLALIAISGLDRAAQTTMIREAGGKAESARRSRQRHLPGRRSRKVDPRSAADPASPPERLGDRRRRVGSILRSDAGRRPIRPDRTGASRAAQDEPPQPVRRTFTGQSVRQAVRGRATPHASRDTWSRSSRRSRSAIRVRRRSSRRRCCVTSTANTTSCAPPNFSAFTSTPCANDWTRFARSPAAGTTRFPRWNCTSRCASTRSPRRRSGATIAP